MLLFDVTDKPTGMAQETKEQETRLLFVTTYESSLQKATAFLIERHYDVRFVTTLGAAVKVIPEFKPEVILLSWNLSHVNVREACRLLSMRCEAVVAVYSEIAKSSVVRRMNAAGIENTILPPVSGASLLTRVKIMLSRKQAEENLVQIKSSEQVTNDQIYFFEKGVSQLHKYKQEVNPSMADVPKMRTAALEASLRTAVSKRGKALAKGMQAIKKATSRLAVLPVKTSQFKGFLICTEEDHRLMADHLKEVFDNVMDDMRQRGEQVEALAAITEIKVNPFMFEIWAKAKADFTVAVSNGELVHVHAFMSDELMPLLVDEDEEHFFAVKAEPNLLDGSKLTFDVFLKFRANKKFLQYLNAGSNVSQTFLTKLKMFGVHSIYIRKAQKAEFYAYRFTHHLDAA